MPAGSSRYATTKSDDEAKAALAKMEERPILPEERQFWAFRAPVRQPFPSIGAKNPVDAFLLTRCGRKGLKPSPAPIAEA